MDYKELIERLRSNHDCSMACDALEAAAAIETLTADLDAAIAGHETLQKELARAKEERDAAISEFRGFSQDKPRWISVKERLPDEKSGRVIMTDGERYYIAPREWMHRINGEAGIYIPANHGAGAKVTHWMPLPEPPEEGTE